MYNYNIMADEWVYEYPAINIIHIRDIIINLGPVKSKRDLREGLESLGWKKKIWFSDFYYYPDFKPNYWM